MIKKILKWLSIILVAFIGLGIALIIALPFLVNPNDFKKEITAEVQQRTGRTLTIDGDIHLTVFPWLGLQLGSTRLSNAPGFGQAPMLQVKAVKLGVKLLPLFKNQFQIDQTTIDGLQLNLQRHANGTTNWDDLVKPAKPGQSRSTSSQQSAALPLSAIAIGGLQLQNAHLSWNDQQSKQHWQVDNLDLNSGAIQWGKGFPLKLAMTVEAKHLKLRAQTKLATRIKLFQDKRIELDQLKLAQQVWSPQLPNSPMEAQASAEQTNIDLTRQTVDINKLQLQNHALVINATAHATQILSMPEYQARIQIPTMNLRDWLTGLKIALPANLPHSAFSKFESQFTVKGDTHAVAVQQLDLTLDNSHLQGNLSLPAFTPLQVRYQLTLDKIDVDAYLPQSESKQVAASPAAGAAAASQLPMGLLRSLDIKGNFNIGQLTVSHLDIQKIETELNAQKGLIRLHPLRAKLYAGTYDGDLQLNAQGTQPSLSTNEHLQGVQLGPLLKDFIGDDKLHGTTELRARLTTRGSDVDSMRQHLDGSLTADLRDGYLKGIDIDYAERRLQAQIHHQPLPEKPAKPQTGFSKMTAAFNLKQGVAHTQTLTAQLPHARMQGNGDIDLVREQLNMTLNFKFSSDVAGQAGKSYAELDRVALPVHLSGPLTKPKYDIDFDGALKALLKREFDKRKAEEKAKIQREIEQRKAEEKAKLQKKVDEEKQQMKEKLQQKANDFLKNLLNR